MAITCTAASLAAAAVDFDRLSDRELIVVQTYLLAQINVALNPTAPTTAKGLEALAVSFAGVSAESIMEIADYLLCQIASAAGA